MKSSHLFLDVLSNLLSWKVSILFGGRSHCYCGGVYLFNGELGHGLLGYIRWTISEKYIGEAKRRYIPTLIEYCCISSLYDKMSVLENPMKIALSVSGEHTMSADLMTAIEI